MTAAHRVRLALQRAGLDIARFPQSRPEHRRDGLLRYHRVSTVLDVGANRGQYAQALRRFGFSGPVVSFEPLPEAFAQLTAQTRRDPRWRAFPYALGAEEATVELHVAGNGGASSSVLPMLDAHERSAPAARYVGVERVRQRRLDDVLTELALPPTERLFLKLDVQGYEQSVLEGLGSWWSALTGLQVELSLVPLYEGGLLYRTALDELAARGFVLHGVEPGFTDPATGRLLQMDGLFFRDGRPA